MSKKKLPSHLIVRWAVNPKYQDKIVIRNLDMTNTTDMVVIEPEHLDEVIFALLKLREEIHG